MRSPSIASFPSKALGDQIRTKDNGVADGNKDNDLTEGNTDDVSSELAGAIDLCIKEGVG